MLKDWIIFVYYIIDNNEEFWLLNFLRLVQPANCNLKPGVFWGFNMMKEVVLF